MLNKGTVVYVGAFQLPDKNAAAHRVVSNAKVLRKLGYNVVFIDIDMKLKSETLVDETFKTVQGFDNWSLPYPNSLKEQIKYNLEIKSVIKIIEKYSDVKLVICYNYMAIPLHRLYKYCSGNKIKIIADITEWYSVKKNSMGTKIIKGIDSFLRMNILHKKLDGAIVISTFLKQYYDTHLPVLVLPPLVDKEEEKWSFDKKFLNSEKKDLSFIYAGSPGKDKDQLHLVLKAFNNVDSKFKYNFNIIGISEEDFLEYHPDFKEILKKYRDKIFFHGILSNKESINMVYNADFTIFIREKNRMTDAGFPTKFVESITCGTPVLTTNTSDLESYIIQGENGYLLDIHNIEQTLEIVLNISTNKTRSKKNKNINTDMFDFNNYINQTELFLDKIK